EQGGRKEIGQTSRDGARLAVARFVPRRRSGPLRRRRLTHFGFGIKTAFSPFTRYRGWRGIDVRPEPFLRERSSAMPELIMSPVADPIAELPTESPERAPLGLRLVTLVAITVPLGGLLAALVLLWGWGIIWVDLGLL